MRIKPSDNLKEITLLYVEDDAAIRETLAMILDRYVGVLEVATNGQEGLEIARRIRPDMILSDIRMPKLSGLEMARIIKKEQPDIAIIFSTAFGESQYLQEAIELGVEGYLIKPIDRDKLVEKLNFLADAIINRRHKEAYYTLLSRVIDSFSHSVVLAKRGGEIVLSNLAYKKFCLALGCKDFDDINGLKRFMVDKKGCCYSSNEQKLLHDWLGKERQTKTVCFLIGGETRYYELRFSRIEGLFLYELQEVTHLFRQTIALNNEVVTDGLTGVYNRKFAPILKESLVKKSAQVCVLFCDIDHFKKVNDTYGHQVGDLVLCRVADRLKNSIRVEDRLIRWGGEEFLIVLDGIDRDNAMKVAEKIRQAVANEPLEQVGHVTISIGISCAIVSHASIFDELVIEADEALYRAKERGRNRVEYFVR